MLENLVCDICFEESGIKQFITINGEHDKCSFCSRESYCLPIECVIDHINECLQPYYTDDPEGVYDAEEGVYREALDPHDILNDTVFEGCWNVPEDIYNILIRNCFEDRIWTLRDPYGEDYWWERFSSFVKYERRYFFLEAALNEEEPSLRGTPKEMLLTTLEDCKNLLIKKENLKLFRCRQEFKNESLSLPEDFLSPPPEKALTSNRMNPPGIPYFYATTDSDTALAETNRGEGIYKIAELELRDVITLVDLSELPPIPSMFNPDPSIRSKLSRHTFIHRFANEINKPICSDERKNIDYIPSQVFCEYIKENAPDINGVIYTSRKFSSGKNVCLFIKREKLKEIISLERVETKVI